MFGQAVTLEVDVDVDANRFTPQKFLRPVVNNH